MSGLALSLAVGMTANAAWSLEAGERVPRIDTVEKLASALQMSPCQLAFGISPSCEPATTPPSAGLPARLLQARELRVFSRKELGRRSETSDGFVRMTETGATVPTIAKVEQLAEALGVSPCWLAYGVGTRDLSPRRRSRSTAQPPAAAVDTSA